MTFQFHHAMDTNYSCTFFLSWGPYLWFDPLKQGQELFAYKDDDCIYYQYYTDNKNGPNLPTIVRVMLATDTCAPQVCIIQLSVYSAYILHIMQLYMEINASGYNVCETLFALPWIRIYIGFLKNDKNLCVYVQHNVFEMQSLFRVVKLRLKNGNEFELQETLSSISVYIFCGDESSIQLC